jgi:hypothetical protein
MNPVRESTAPESNDPDTRSRQWNAFPLECAHPKDPEGVRKGGSGSLASELECSWCWSDLTLTAALVIAR